MGERLEVIDELERRLLATCYGRASWQQRVRSPRTWVPATAITGSAGVAMAIALLAGGGVAPPLAQAALNRVARAAANAPSTALVPGKDWYVRAVITGTASLPLLAEGSSTPAAPPKLVPMLTHTVEEIWMTRDGASHLRSRTNYAFANPGAAARRGEKPLRPETEIIGSPRNGLLSSPLGQQRLISYRHLRALPVSVAGLSRVIDQIRARLRIVPPPVPAQTLTTPAAAQTPAAPLDGGPQSAAAIRAFGELKVISWLLAMPVPVAVRAALYRTAASVKGVHYDGAVRDPLGRRGVEVSVESGGVQLRMIFDPKTGQLLSTSTSFRPLADGRVVRPLVETIVTEKIVPDASRPASTRAKRRG